MVTSEPLAPAAVQETEAEVSPAVADTLVAAPGGPEGVTLLEASEADPSPLALVATTVKVYAVPLVRPVTVHDVVAVVQVLAPVELVTV